MRHIANILTDDPFPDEVLYNVVSDKGSLKEGLPTLVVGWEKTKAEYPGASIVEWPVGKGVYWTYGKYERREKYEENTRRFRELAFKTLFETVGYVFFDVLSAPPERIESFVASLSSPSAKTVYASNDMLYICYDGISRVFGVSLRDCDYLDPGLRKRVFSALYKNDTARILRKDEDVPRETRYRIKGKDYIIPYLFG